MSEQTVSVDTPPQPKIADPKCPRCLQVLNFAHRIMVTQNRVVGSLRGDASLTIKREA